MIHPADASILHPVRPAAATLVQDVELADALHPSDFPLRRRESLAGTIWDHPYAIRDPARALGQWLRIPAEHISPTQHVHINAPHSTVAGPTPDSGYLYSADLCGSTFIALADPLRQSGALMGFDFGGPLTLSKAIDRVLARMGLPERAAATGLDAWVIDGPNAPDGVLATACHLLHSHYHVRPAVARCPARADCAQGLLLDARRSRLIAFHLDDQHAKAFIEQYATESIEQRDGDPACDSRSGTTRRYRL